MTCVLLTSLIDVCVFSRRFALFAVEKVSYQPEFPRNSGWR